MALPAGVCSEGAAGLAIKHRNIRVRAYDACC